MTTDYDAIRGKILDLIGKAGLSFSVSPTLETVNRSESDEMKGVPLTFAFSLWIKEGTPGREGFSGTYSAGVGIADREALDNGAAGFARDVLRDATGFRVHGIHKTVDGVATLRKLRSRYRPGIVDVVSALACDADSVANVDSWEDWAEEYGFLSGTDSADPLAEKLRKVQRDYMACKDAARFLARAFRSNVETLLSLCREL